MPSHLSGRVQHVQLPVFSQPTGPDAPVLKRLLLPQGELAQFHDSDEAMRYLALVELKEGGVRGNHFHRVKKEFIYAISGAFDLVVADPETRAPIEIIPISAGELAIIEPGIAHALRTRTPGHAIEFSPSRFDRADTYRHDLGDPPINGR